MSLFPCAVVDSTEAPAAGMVITALDSTLKLIEAPRLSLVVSEPATGTPDPREAIGWIADLHRVIDIVPMQFGELLASEAEGRELLARREPQMVLALDAIRGRTEFGVRLHVSPPQVPAPQPPDSPDSLAPRAAGSSYLRRRAAHYAADDGIPTGLTPRVQAWVSDFKIPGMRARLEGPSSMVKFPAVYFLVPRNSVGEFLDQYNQLKNVLDIETSLSGPWAPFNFVRGIDANG